MLLTEVVLKLRADCPLFERRVGGTAKFSNVTDGALADTMDVPCAFVVPLDTAGEERANEQYTATWVTERFAVLVCVSNRVDRSRGSGISASDNITLAENQMYDSLVGWRPVFTAIGKGTPSLVLGEESILNGDDHMHFFEDVGPASNMGCVGFESAQHLAMTPARLWHEFQYTVRYLRDKTDPALRDIGGLTHELQKLYGGFSQDIGLQHIDDYELMVDTTEGDD